MDRAGRRYACAWRSIRLDAQNSLRSYVMFHRICASAVAAAIIVIISSHATAAEPTIKVDSTMTPPAWALLEREVLRMNAAACEEFFAKYFDERGFLLCVERWGGDDGPDDAIENVNDWPLLYALGAPENVKQMVEKAWEGHLRQYTLD